MVLAWLLGCGARSEGVLGERAATEVVPSGGGGEAPAPTTPSPPASSSSPPSTKPLSLSLLRSEVEVLPGGEGAFSFARLVVREGMLDVLASRDGPPFEVMARRAQVSSSAPFVQWQTEPFVLMPGVVSGTVAAAAGSVLSVCHNQFNGDDTSFSSFTGAYSKQSGPLFVSHQASCQGLAFRGEQGMLAYHALPSTCCSRPLVVHVDSAGKPQDEPSLALPEGQFGNVRLSDYRSGFAWAGFVSKDDGSKQMMVRFLRDGALSTHTFDATSPDVIAPQLASWPFGDAVALTYQRDETSVRLVIIDEQGKLLRDEALAPPVGGKIYRAPLAASPRGLVRANTRCASDFSPTEGALEIALLGATPEQSASLTVPIACQAGAFSVAVVNDVIVALLATQQGLRAWLVGISG